MVRLLVSLRAPPVGPIDDVVRVKK
jgi:hypothetical protein